MNLVTCVLAQSGQLPGTQAFRPGLCAVYPTQAWLAINSSLQGDCVAMARLSASQRRHRDSLVCVAPDFAQIPAFPIFLSC